ncbi:DUF3383 family protein [Yersinia bercovieri]|uniref:DUF3383 family protein n=1 Tax=Yersinia bercovieri TaxID=634 RepID=UPI0005E62C9C|nr:DUF3383 family protein [Yersinia bercovieri]CNI61481.1 Protein of uncharacterised function (DUF3383) [Yersinia bercovieri]
MSKIPLSRDFKITPSTVNAAGTALDVYGLLLSDNELLPVGEVSEFTSAADVGAALGTTSKEYLAASLYMSGYDNSTVRPGAVLFGRLVQQPVAGWLLSGSFKGVKIDALKSITGTITLTVDGTPVTSSALVLTAVTSFSDAATTIAAAIGSSVTVDWLPVQSRFIIRSATTGAASYVSQATVSAAATELKLTADTAATVSPGAIATSITDTMAAIVNQNQDWVIAASLVDLTDEKKEELCAWVSASTNRYAYSMYDTSEDATVANNESCFVQSVVIANGYENVFPVYGSYLYAVLALAYSASLNFNRTNGRVSYKFRAFAGIAPNVTNNATAAALESNGYNFYGAYGQNKTLANYVSDGAITGKFLWLDSFISQVWINANLVAAFANLFTNNASYAFNAGGYASISAAVIDVATNAINFGAIRAGVTLDQAQINIVNDAVGTDISNVLYTQGWFFFIPQQTGASRTERSLDGAIFYYVDGQLIQSIDMTSTNIL